MYWNEYDTKKEIKNTANEYRYLLQSNFVVANGLFVLLYTNQDKNAKRYKARRYYLSKGITKNYNAIINGKNVYDQPNDSHVKRYKEIKKLAIGPGEDYTTGCLLKYNYIKSHYKLIAVNLSRQKEVDTGPKIIRQI